jgi:hypothetical protein
MTPARTLLAAAVLLSALAAAPAGAATHNCSADALAAAKSGPVTAYFPSACYDAARIANGSGSSAVSARLQTAKTRDAKRSLNAKITGNDTVKLGGTLQLKVATSLKVRGLRVQLVRLGSGGGATPVSTAWMTGTTKLVPVHPGAKGTLRYRINLGFVLNGKVIGASSSPTLTIHVT